MIVIIIGLAIVIAISLCFRKGSHKQPISPSEPPQEKESLRTQPKTEPTVTDNTVKSESKKKKKKKEEEGVQARSGKQL